MRTLTCVLAAAVWLVACGDAEPGENTNDNSNQNNNQTGDVCGDGQQTGPEECDDGAANSDTAPDACRTDCTRARCGDGVADAGEACDDGPANSDVVPDACRSTCLLPTCGDGVVDVGAGERCDCGDPAGPPVPSCAYPNGHAEGACGVSCQVYICGNGVLDPGEACDDGNTQSGDGCSANCLSDEACGNGYVDAATEACDDGNAVNRDGCHSGCVVERPTWRPWPAFSPARAAHALAFHDGIGRLVLFGAEVTPATWELEGPGWAFAETPQVPFARIGTALAYDQARDRLVLFGGLHGANVFSDTWEYDGADWTRITTVDVPEPRAAHALAWDAGQGEAVLFGGIGLGGTRGDTWAYDGGSWVDLAPVTTPSPRLNHRMAYDALRGRVVLFGGCDHVSDFGLCNGTTLGDTWEFDGVDWLLRSPAVSPSPRSGHAMAWDPDRGQVVLFGGRPSGGTATTNELWSWDGTTWAAVSAPGGPSARGGHAMAYDPDQQRLVVQGGCTNFRDGAAPCIGAPLADTWALVGTTWTNLTTPAAPPERAFAALARDGRGRLVMHAGHDGAAALSDTWEFTGTHWAPGAVGGPEVAGHAMAYDPVRDRVVLFGGCQELVWNALNVCSAGAERAETWEYDGASWLQRTPAQSPSPRYWHGMVFDENRGTVLLHGGILELTTLYTDTWEYDGTTWTEVTTATQPPGVAMGSLLWDAARGVVVRVGGGGANGLFETWELDGTDWTQRVFTEAPANRLGQLAVYDPSRAVTVLFGGCVKLELQGFFFLDCTLSLDDTWEYDGLAWVPLGVTAWPEARLGAVGAFDPAGRGVFLHGGASGLSGIFGDTWRYRRDATRPGERCDNGADDDGDGFADCDDPDCEGARCRDGTCQGGACVAP